MEAHLELGAALTAALGLAGPDACLVDEAIDRSHALDRAERLPARDLVRRLGAGPRPALVALARPTPTLLRACLDSRPPLVVLTGDADRDVLAALGRAGIAVLGPSARLYRGDGDLVVVAPDAELLDELTRALGPARVGLALAPAAPWLCAWLSHPLLVDLPAVGFVDASALHRGWTEWLRALPIADAARHLLVPLGVEPPRVAEPRHAALEAIVAAHTMERLSGPVFPSPPVLAALIAAATPSAAIGEPRPALRGLWAQARRALPLAGAAPGMEAPLAGLRLADPPAAFLAQRAILRRQRGLALTAEPFDRPPAPDGALTQRSLEVLRSAGEVLSEHESKVVLRGFDVEVTRQAVASSASGAASFAEQIGFPVVLKAVSPDLRRKHELGAVQLDLANAAAVRRAYATILANIEQNAPTAHLDGVLVAEMAPPGLEIHCGVVRLADGHAALYGRPLGVSAPHDHVLAPCPLDPPEALLLAHAVLTRLPVPALRRRSDPDVRTLAGLFLRLDALVRATGDRLLSVDLNPIRLVDGPRGYVTLDARIVQRPHLEGL